MVTSPALLLEKAVAQRVVLLLKDGRQIPGRLQGTDEHLNVVLEESEETGPNGTRRLGRIVVRGSNVISVHSPDGPTSARPS